MTCTGRAEARDRIREAAEMIGPLAERDRPIGELTTYRVGGRAALFSEPARFGDLERLAGAVGATGVPVLVIGKGSNLLVADCGYPGLCVRLGDGFSWIGTEGYLLRAGGAAAYPVLARRSAAAGLTGMEWAVGIPGSVGGGVRMNAGGHGAETSDRLLACRIVSLHSGETREVLASELDLAYRHSAIGPGDVVVEASFQLEPGDAPSCAERISEIVRWRREHQPGGQNAGSVFQNPHGNSAGHLIEVAGLKGLRIGTAAVSEKHANFIQADAGGSADDVRRVIDAVRSLVAERLGVELRTELQVVGFEEGL